MKRYYVQLVGVDEPITIWAHSIINVPSHILPELSFLNFEDANKIVIASFRLSCVSGWWTKPGEEKPA